VRLKESASRAGNIEGAMQVSNQADARSEAEVGSSWRSGWPLLWRGTLADCTTHVYIQWRLRQNWRLKNRLDFYKIDVYGYIKGPSKGHSRVSSAYRNPSVTEDAHLPMLLLGLICTIYLTVHKPKSCTPCYPCNATVENQCPPSANHSTLYKRCESSRSDGET
jgi:hypothetical protein